MKRRITISTIVLSSVLLLVLTSLAGSASPVQALLCPLEAGSSTVTSCGCNPPMERVEPNDTIPCTSCPPTESVQPKSTICECPTYCKVTDGSSSGSSTGTTVTPTPPPAPISTSQQPTCQKVVTRVNTTLNRLATSGQQQYELITSIATKAETYYTNSGKTLPNYATLAGAVNDAKAAAAVQVNSLSQDKSTGFKCTQDNAKTMAADYITDAKATIAALQTYRQAVKALILGLETLSN